MTAHCQVQQVFCPTTSRALCHRNKCSSRIDSLLIRAFRFSPQDQAVLHETAFPWWAIESGWLAGWWAWEWYQAGRRVTISGVQSMGTGWLQCRVGRKAGRGSQPRAELFGPIWDAYSLAYISAWGPSPQLPDLTLLWTKRTSGRLVDGLSEWTIRVFANQFVFPTTPLL